MSPPDQYAGGTHFFIRVIIYQPLNYCLIEGSLVQVVALPIHLIPITKPLMFNTPLSSNHIKAS
jgi:hypothetical protein